jgi:hypothetical protein
MTRATLAHSNPPAQPVDPGGFTAAQLEDDSLAEELAG